MTYNELVAEIFLQILSNYGRNSGNLWCHKDARDILLTQAQECANTIWALKYEGQ